MDKTQQSSGDSPSATQTPINETNPTGEMLPSSLCPSPNSGVTDELCHATGRLNVVDIQKSNDEKLVLKGADNRPGIERLCLSHCTHDKLREKIQVDIFFPSNIPVYDSAFLGWGHFHQLTTIHGLEGCSAIRIILRGSQDNAIEQLAIRLSTTIHEVVIYDASPYYLTVAQQLLKNATIGSLHFIRIRIDDTTAPAILSIASRLKPRTNRLLIRWSDTTGLSNPVSFVTTLCAGVTSLYIEKIFGVYQPFFGLPNSFWAKYFNEKLSSGSVGWIDVDEKITKGPVNIDPFPLIYSVAWGQAGTCMYCRPFCVQK